jgi:hypothetical protein
VHHEGGAWNAAETSLKRERVQAWDQQLLALDPHMAERRALLAAAAGSA